MYFVLSTLIISLMMIL